MDDKPVRVKGGYLITRDGMRLCRVVVLPDSCQLIFYDRNRRRRQKRGAANVMVNVLDIVRAVAESDK